MIQYYFRNKSALHRLITYYILAIIIVSSSFHNIFMYNTDAKLLLVIIGLLLFVYCRVEITKNLIISFVLFSLLIVAQGLMFGYSFFTHLSSFYFNIFLAYVMLRYLPIDYTKYVSNVIFVLSVVSFIIWILCNLNPSIGILVQLIAYSWQLDPIPPTEGLPEQILIFTYEQAMALGMFRNAGFAHEPGGFAVALVYAIVTNTLRNSVLFSKKNVFLMICMVTTFSSAGYMSLYIILLWSMLSIRASTLVKFNMVIAGLVVIAYSFISLDFMSSKIADQYEVGTQMDLTENTDGRIFASRKALYVLGTYPLFGRGFITASKVDDPASKEAVGYGFPSFASQIGLPLFFIFLFLSYKSLKGIPQVDNFRIRRLWLISLSFVPVLFAQALLPSLIFNMLFLSVIFIKKLPKVNQVK
jgi:hypothetical protein